MARVTINQAALTALAGYLRVELAGPTVADRWPDPAQKVDPTAGMVTCLLAGDAQEIWTQPVWVTSLDKAIHGATSARITEAIATNTATAITRLNAARTSYETHRAATPTHAAADAVNVIATPAATDLPTALTLANEMRLDVPAHEASATYHTNADTGHAITPPVATNEATLVTLVNAIVVSLNSHYPAVVFAWRTVEVEQNVQVDVWTTADISRDDLRERLNDALNQPPILTAPGLTYAAADATDQQIILPLAGDWAGLYARFVFDTARNMDDGEERATGRWRAMVLGKFYAFQVRWVMSPAIKEISAPLTLS